jgi:hypothetical protein
MEQMTNDILLERMIEDATEDFALVDVRDLTDPLKFYHKVIRSKYFGRLQRMFEKKFKSNFQRYNHFEVLMCIEDHHEFYGLFYKERKALHNHIDGKFFTTLKQNLRSEAAPSNAPASLEGILKEFKLLVEVLVDYYDRAQLYNLLDFENVRRFFKFDVKCTTINDIVIPFFLARLFGGLNKASSKALQKLFMFLVTNVIKVNFFATSLLLPEFDFVFRSDNFFGKKIEKLIFSRLFRTQREQIFFMFSALNTMLAEHIAELESSFQAFFANDEPLNFKDFLANYEILNAKFDEVNKIKFPSKQGETLDIKEVCRMTDFKHKSETARIRQQQDAHFFDAVSEFGEDYEHLKDEEYWRRAIALEEAEEFRGQPACITTPIESLDRQKWDSSEFTDKGYGFDDFETVDEWNDSLEATKRNGDNGNQESAKIKSNSTDPKRAPEKKLFASFVLIE